MNQLKTYKVKLNPTHHQAHLFRRWLGASRFMYNLCLDYKKTLYEMRKQPISKYQIQKELKNIKNEIPWMKEVHSQVVQNVTDRLFSAFDHFFRRVKKGEEKPGYPRFAKKDLWKSFQFKQGFVLDEEKRKIKLPKIGNIQYHKSQSIKGEIRTVSIKKEADGWHASICCMEDIQPDPKNNNAVGIDLGIKDFLVSSDGEVYENPKTLSKWENKLIKTQRELSRKKKGSNNRNKTKRKLQKLHQKVARVRKDFLHKISSQIISENQVIVCENLNIQGMVKNHKLSKSIYDVSWGMFMNILSYKAQWHGKTFIKVAPHHTSQECHHCGWKKKDLSLDQREWTCQGCGSHHHRDENAAINILNKGMEKIKQEAGHVFFTLKDEGDIDGIAHRAEEPHAAELK